MELSFATQTLRGICESRRRAASKLGAEAALALEAVLADIESCESATELIAIYGDLAQLAETDVIEVKPENGLTVVITCGHVTTPRRKDGRVDWKKVTRIRITGIEGQP